MKRPSASGGGLPFPSSGTRGLDDWKETQHMGIGVSIFLLAVGAILAFAVDIPTNGLNLDTVGVIFMILGLVGLLASLVFWSDWAPRSRAVGYDDRDVVVRRRRPRVVDVDDDPVVGVVEDRPVVERRRVTTRRTTYDGF
jgi:hypothetical protein